MDLGRIVRFTNISDSDFTHLYHAQQFTVKSNESVLFPYDLGRHLAKHLARKILLGNAKVEELKNDRALFNEETEKEMITKILGDETQAAVSPELSEAERLRRRVDELNAHKPEGAPEGRTKADVIAEMETKGLPVDKRKTMATLESELKATI